MKEPIKANTMLNWKFGAALWLVVAGLLIGEQIRGSEDVQNSVFQEVEQQAEIDLAKIKDRVADDAVEQYHMVAMSGTVIDQCVQAGIVSASFLQKQDQTGYQKWKDIEKNDCDRAGLPN